MEEFKEEQEKEETIIDQFIPIKEEVSTEDTTKAEDFIQDETIKNDESIKEEVKKDEEALDDGNKDSTLDEDVDNNETDSESEEDEIDEENSDDFIYEDESKKDLLSISANVSDEFSYVIYHADCKMRVADKLKLTEYSFLKGISISNLGENGYSDVIVRTVFSFDGLSCEDIHIRYIDAHQYADLNVPFIKVNNEKMYSVSETIPSSVKFVVYNNNEEILCEREYIFDLLPVAQLSLKMIKDYRLFAKLITPHSPNVKQLALIAATKTKRGCITGYLNKSKDVMLDEIKAVFDAIKEWNITYQLPSATASEMWRTRLPEEVLNDHKGTCLDFSYLYCACLEELGYHSILLFVKDHALMGVFLDDKDNTSTNESTFFHNCICENRGLLSNLTGSKILFINAVSCVNDTSWSFQDAIDQANSQYVKHYDDNRFIAIDVNSCHKTIYSPIPAKGEEVELNTLVDNIRTEDKKLESIIDSGYIDITTNERENKYSVWEKKLLDLNESNPLVNFKMKSSNIVRLISDNNLGQTLLSKETFSFEFIPFPDKKDKEVVVKSELKPKDLLFVDSCGDLIYALGDESILKSIIKKADETIEETGSSTLFICLGTLTFKRKTGVDGLAPFIVLPIKKINKNKNLTKYYLEYDLDELMINKTFFEYYRAEHPNVDYTGFYNIQASDGYDNIIKTFKNQSIENIAIDEKCIFISNMTFSHYVMWNDIRKRRDELEKNAVIQSFVANKNLLNDRLNYSDTEIDSIEKYKEFAAPLPYDSTQLKAILECGDGHSFILDGPPGTGKSQTIVNMIVNAFYHGKSVLFVAEKKAALDVVYDRLSQIQLDRFCLELHSQKANKGSFYKKLSESMDLGKTKSPEEFDKCCEDLEKERDELLALINSMHENKKYCYSLYDVIVKYEELKGKGCEHSISLVEEYLSSLTQEEVQTVEKLLDKYVSATKELEDYDNSALKYFEMNEFVRDDETVNSLILDFNILKDKISAFEEKYNELVKLVTLKVDDSYLSTVNIVEAFNCAIKKDIYWDKLEEYIDITDEDKIIELFNVAQKIAIFKQKYIKVFDYRILENVQVDDCIAKLNTDKNVFVKFINKISCNSVLSKALLKGSKIDKNNLLNIFNEIKNYQLDLKYIRENSEPLDKKTGFKFIDMVDSFEQIIENYNDTKKFIECVNIMSKDMTIADVITFFANAKNNIGIKMIFGGVISAYDMLKNYEKDVISKKYLINYKALRTKENPIEIIKSIIDIATNNDKLSEITYAVSVNQLAEKINDIGLKKLINNIKLNVIQVDDLINTYDFSVAKGIISLYFSHDPTINYFNPSNFDNELKKYRDYIQNYSNKIVEYVSAKMSQKLIHNTADYMESSPIGQLKKSFTMKNNQPSIRDTLIRFDKIIKDYFPCFLMSPLSAAQYLGIDDKNSKGVSKFDIVIFDEASQIPTHEAVGPIARGNALIVAGDPLQMPPSAYFSSEYDVDNIELQDSDSLLNECIAIGIPRIRLNYHYRSKHESLIGFSNSYFYNNDLYTFPSKSTAFSEVEFRYVELSVKKDTSDISSDEIDAILKTFKQIYTDEKTYNKSVGIIVFNVRQKDRVEKAISNLLDKNKTLAEQVLKAERFTNLNYFVKSIENVQGDERDIIILSIGFAKSTTGHPIVRGPIVMNNGERRLNVAASRSKEKMIVLSTIKSTDFENDKNLKIRSGGTLALKKFIKYAEEQTFHEVRSEIAQKNSILEFIKRDLEFFGYGVDINVGNSDFRVDVAIKSKDGNSYDLGLLVDMKPIGNGISFRDKMYLQESFLCNSLKWKIKNIYAIEYYTNPKNTIEKIIKALGEEPEVIKELVVNPIIEQATIVKQEFKTTEYKKAKTILRVTYNPEYGFDIATLKKLLNVVVETEGPISYSMLKEYVKDYSNVTKMSKKAEDSLKLALESFQRFTKDFDDKGVETRFYWPSSLQPADYKTFRIFDRNFNDICKEEILAAINQIMEVQISLSTEDLLRATLDAFGNKNLTLGSKSIDRIKLVYEWALNNNKLFIPQEE